MTKPVLINNGYCYWNTRWTELEKWFAGNALMQLRPSEETRYLIRLVFKKSSHVIRIHFLLEPTAGHVISIKDQIDLELGI